MSFSRRSNLEAKKLYILNFDTKGIKGRTINKISKKSFLDVFFLKIKFKEKLKMKTKLFKTKI